MYRLEDTGDKFQVVLKLKVQTKRMNILGGSNFIH